MVVLASPQLCSGHSGGMLPCSAVLSAEPTGAPFIGGGPSSGWHVGFRERGTWSGKGSLEQAASKLFLSFVYKRNNDKSPHMSVNTMCMFICD